jgi:hypothetical protein
MKTLAKITFDDNTFFTIWRSPKAKSDLQSIRMTRAIWRKIAGSLQPYVKRNLIETSSEYYVNWSIPNYHVFQQASVEAYYIGSHRMNLHNENNVPSYLAVEITKHTLSTIQAKLYGERAELAQAHILQYGNSCPICRAAVKLPKNSSWLVACVNGHSTGITRWQLKEIFEKREKAYERMLDSSDLY